MMRPHVCKRNERFGEDMLEYWGATEGLEYDGFQGTKNSFAECDHGVEALYIMDQGLNRQRE